MSMTRCALAVLLVSTPVTAVTQAAQADLILVNGHVVTVDPDNSVVQAVAIRAGRIVAVGSNSRIRAMAKRGAEVIDLQGRTATPGLIDSHAHIAEGGVQALYSVELSDAPDIAEVRRRIAHRAATL
jgi:predicted amidohydrolase YtcJ